MSHTTISAEAPDKAAHEADLLDQSAVRRRTRKFLSAGVIAFGFLLLKLKTLILFLQTQFKLFLVNPFEGFSIGQLLLTGGSMLVSLVAYSVKWDWRLGVGIIVILFIHELGHAFMIRARGLRAGAMVFIPFIGGAVTMRRYPRSVFVDAQIGLAGPIAGTLASLGSLQLFRATGDELYLAIANWGFLLNLFNLTPVRPLDGGRIAAAITKWMWAFGALILVVWLVMWRNPLLLLLVVLSIFQIYGAINREKNKRFYAITPLKRVGVAVVYFALVLLLGYYSIDTYAEIMSLN